MWRLLLACGLLGACAAAGAAEDCDPADETCKAEADDAALLQTRRTAYNDAEDEKQFKEWMKTYKKTYATKAEYSKAFKNFQENLHEMEEYNKANHSDTHGLSQFSDMSPKDFASKYYFTIPNVTDDGKVFEPPDDDSARSLPRRWNWGVYMGPAENQSPCGSCWIFSALGAVEAQMKIKTRGKWVSLSKQGFVSCLPGNPCGGGNPVSIMQWLRDGTYEAYTTESWPYTGSTDTPCDLNNREVGVPQGAVTGTIKVFSVFDGTNQLQWLKVALRLQPLYVCGLLSDAFMQYKDGILENMCDSKNRYSGHCMVLTGWGHKGWGANKVDYWIVRNSWGTDWGIDGYLYVSDKYFMDCFTAKDAMGLAGFPTWEGAPLQPKDDDAQQ